MVFLNSKNFRQATIHEPFPKEVLKNMPHLGRQANKKDEKKKTTGEQINQTNRTSQSNDSDGRSKILESKKENDIDGRA